MTTNSRNPDGYLVSKGYSYYVFGLLFLLYMFDYIDRQIVVSLFPFIKAEWSLSDTQCGALVSAVYWSILLFAFPVSILIDRWSRKNSIGLMAVLWSLATASCAYTRSFSQLFTARAAIGIGEAGYAPGGTAMISALFPKETRAQIMGFWNASIPLGSALGIALGGFIAETWGWRHAFGIVAIPGMLVAILFFFVRDYKTVELAPVQKAEATGSCTQSNYKQIARQFLGTYSLLFAYFGFAANMFVTSAFMSWLPTFYCRTEGIPMSQAGIKGGAVMAMAIIGAPLGGYLADRWGRKRRNARMVFGAITSALTGFFLFAAFALFSGTAQYLVALLAGIFASMFVPGIAAVTQDVVHPGLRATSYSLNVIVMHILGSSIGPIFVGAISDASDLQTALTILPIFSLIGGFLFLIGSRFYASDCDKVCAIDLQVET